jgi:hypothetical protein
MLKTLINTCKELEKDWSRESFPESARKCLEKLSVDSSLREFEAEVEEWLKTAELPKQLNLYNNFGEPSLSLFNNGKFAIDIYFWRKNDTLIHSHGFRGAFKVLYGVSLHEVFEVETLGEFAEDLLNTKLKPQSLKILKKGDVEQINPDMELTHRVVHLNNPTVTLCVRTVEDTELNQWHHFTSGLSFQKRHISEKTVKNNLYFQYLLGTKRKKAKNFYQETLSQLTVAEKISLYEGLFFGELGLEDTATEIAVEMIQEEFLQSKWFDLYEMHYENLQAELQGSMAKTAELRLLAHAINSGFSKDQTSELLAEFSDQTLSKLCEELKTNIGIFVEGSELEQLDKIDDFK